MDDTWCPTTGFFADYVKYTAHHEAPLRFQFWTAATILATTLQRRVYFDKGYYKVFPTFYTVLVAPPGRCRKTTCATIGMNFLMALPAVRIIAEKVTPEQLAHVLANPHVTADGKIDQTATGVIFAPELATLLGKQSYNEGLIDLLNRLYDAPDHWIYESRKARVELNHIAVNLLGCTTPDSMNESMPAIAFGGGFLSRQLLVVERDTPRDEPLPVAPPLAMRERVTMHLMRALNANGELTFSREGNDWYRAWYTQNRVSGNGDLRTAGYFERKPDHILRMISLLLVAEGKDLIVTPAVGERASQILRANEPEMASAITSANTRMTGRDSLRIMDQIRAAGGVMEYAALLRANSNWLTANQIKPILMTLVDAEMLLEFIQGKRHWFELPDFHPRA